jgi:hypothetical protein
MCDCRSAYRRTRSMTSFLFGSSSTERTTDQVSHIRPSVILNIHTILPDFHYTPFLF